ncbi:hypothetical protein KFE25_000466 [Diacronema lutheri]|uniref:RNA polymerase II-associated protein 1 C-terminal domain-containing protein n=1 Tax=Diacronema lutheri TaxID=2081491 RepID=A0A8J6CEQ3_DIALT|nr:hypothetical protein KFE25_000466 [Diacronema lutheri]
MADARTGGHPGLRRDDDGEDDDDLELQRAQAAFFARGGAPAAKLVGRPARVEAGGEPIGASTSAASASLPGERSSGAPSKLRISGPPRTPTVLDATPAASNVPARAPQRPPAAPGSAASDALHGTGGKAEPHAPEHQQAVLGEVVERTRSRSSCVGGAGAPSAPLFSAHGFPQAQHRDSAEGRRFGQGRDARRQGAAALGAAASAAAATRAVGVASASRPSPHAAAASGAGALHQLRLEIDAENARRVDGMSAGEVREAQRELLDSFGPGIAETLRKVREARERRAASAAAPPAVRGDQGAGTALPNAHDASLAARSAGAAASVVSAGGAGEASAEKASGTCGMAIAQRAANVCAATRPAASAPDSACVPGVNEAMLVAARVEAEAEVKEAEEAVEALDEAEFDDVVASQLFAQASEPVPLGSSARAAALPAALAALARAAPRAFRFDFAGRPVARGEVRPRTAALHHHGKQHDEAGYTIAELLHLLRSSVPAQRAIAARTLAAALSRAADAAGGGGGGGDRRLEGEGEGAGDTEARDALLSVAVWTHAHPDLLLAVSAALDETAAGALSAALELLVALLAVVAPALVTWRERPMRPPGEPAAHPSPSATTTCAHPPPPPPSACAWHGWHGEFVASAGPAAAAGARGEGEGGARNAADEPVGVDGLLATDPLAALVESGASRHLASALVRARLGAAERSTCFRLLALCAARSLHHASAVWSARGLAHAVCAELSGARVPPAARTSDGTDAADGTDADARLDAIALVEAVACAGRSLATSVVMCGAAEALTPIVMTALAAGAGASARTRRECCAALGFWRCLAAYRLLPIGRLSLDAAYPLLSAALRGARPPAADVGAATTYLLEMLCATLCIDGASSPVVARVGAALTGGSGEGDDGLSDMPHDAPGVDAWARIVAPHAQVAADGLAAMARTAAGTDAGAGAGAPATEATEDGGAGPATGGTSATGGGDDADDAAHVCALAARLHFAAAMAEALPLRAARLRADGGAGIAAAGGWLRARGGADAAALASEGAPPVALAEWAERQAEQHLEPCLRGARAPVSRVSRELIELFARCGSFAPGGGARSAQHAALVRADAILGWLRWTRALHALNRASVAQRLLAPPPAARGSDDAALADVVLVAPLRELARALTDADIAMLAPPPPPLASGGDAADALSAALRRSVGELCAVLSLTLAELGAALPLAVDASESARGAVEASRAELLLLAGDSARRALSLLRPGSEALAAQLLHVALLSPAHLRACAALADAAAPRGALGSAPRWAELAAGVQPSTLLQPIVGVCAPTAALAQSAAHAARHAGALTALRFSPSPPPPPAAPGARPPPGLPGLPAPPHVLLYPLRALAHAGGGGGGLDVDAAMAERIAHASLVASALLLGASLARARDAPAPSAGGAARGSARVVEHAHALALAALEALTLAPQVAFGARVGEALDAALRVATPVLRAARAAVCDASSSAALAEAAIRAFAAHPTPSPAAARWVAFLLRTAEPAGVRCAAWDELAPAVCARVDAASPLPCGLAELLAPVEREPRLLGAIDRWLRAYARRVAGDAAARARAPPLMCALALHALSGSLMAGVLQGRWEARSSVRALMLDAPVLALAAVCCYEPADDGAALPGAHADEAEDFTDDAVGALVSRAQRAFAPGARVPAARRAAIALLLDETGACADGGSVGLRRDVSEWWARAADGERATVAATLDPYLRLSQ